MDKNLTRWGYGRHLSTWKSSTFGHHIYPYSENNQESASSCPTLTLKSRSPHIIGAIQGLGKNAIPNILLWVPLKVQADIFGWSRLISWEGGVPRRGEINPNITEMMTWIALDCSGSYTICLMMQTVKITRSSRLGCFARRCRETDKMSEAIVKTTLIPSSTKPMKPEITFTLNHFSSLRFQKKRELLSVIKCY